MPQPPRGFILLLLCLIAPHARGADLSLSLPLGPYYRPGKYVPVRVAASLREMGAYTLTVTAAGARDVSLNAREGRVEAVVPWQVVSPRVGRPRLLIEGRPGSAVEGPELKRLADAERLVGWTTPDESFARQLLGGAAKIIPVSLDPAHPIPGHAAAWEMLDAVLLDAAAATRLDEAQLANLLAGGVTVAVKTPEPPFPKWPWKRTGEYAVLRPQLAGPATGGYSDAVYLPVLDWQPGWPSHFRRRLLLVGGMCCLPFLGLALWRPRFTPVWAVVLGAATCGGLYVWRGTELGVRQAGGEVVVLHPDGVTQTDRWTYQTATAARAARLAWQDVTHPLVAEDLKMGLYCDAQGQPVEFRARIPANRKVAFLARTVGLRSPRTVPELPITSPLDVLADEEYSRDGGRLVGQLPAPPEVWPRAGYAEIRQWPALVVDRRPVAGPGR